MNYWLQPFRLLFSFCLLRWIALVVADTITFHLFVATDIPIMPLSIDMS